MLCCLDPRAGALSWLRRQRFKVEEAVPAGFRVGAKVPANVLYDIVLLAQEAGALCDPDAQQGVLNKAMGHVRPGGRLLLVCSNDSLFDTVAPETVAEQVGACFSEVGVVSEMERVSGLEAFTETVYSIKKGGAYKPRLPVIYVDDAAAFATVCKRLNGEACIGLDVETTLKEPRILCTVQMATEHQIYVVDMLPIKELAPLKELMENSGVLKIIHNKDFEATVLRQYGIEIHHVYDTLVESRKRHRNKKVSGHRLGDVCARELGIYLDKTHQASDWTRRPLSRDQLDYAAVDAEVMIRLYQCFVPPAPPETMDLF